MVFNSYIFVFVFLPICLIGYYLLGHIPNKIIAKLWLLGCSFVCYSYVNPVFILFLIASILINYGINCYLRKASQCRKIILTGGLILNLGSLLYYKYTNFFLENVNSLFKTDFTLMKLVMPLGISFFTFKQIGYIVDSYKNPEKTAYSLLDFALFISFFPQLIAGPIAYHDELIPQFHQKTTYRFQLENFSAGVTQFCYGLGKKLLLADVLSGFVAVCFSEREAANSTLAILGMLAYTIQIYFDFSGYSDMAVGVGRMLNIETVENFNSPYKAVTIGDFWKRWHISLTRFFTKYVYFPLGGSRKGEVRTYVNVMIIFFLSGLWHGADWTFIIWGLMHGAAQVFDKLCKPLIQKIPSVITWFITFVFVNFAWVFFRAENLESAVELIKEMFAGKFLALDETMVTAFLTPEIEWILTLINHLEWQIYLPYVFIAVAAGISLFMTNVSDKIKSGSYKSIPNAIWVSVLAVLSIMSFSTVTSFIYMNF